MAYIIPALSYGPYNNSQHDDDSIFDFPESQGNVSEYKGDFSQSQGDVAQSDSSEPESYFAESQEIPLYDFESQIDETPSNPVPHVPKKGGKKRKAAAAPVPDYDFENFLKENNYYEFEDLVKEAERLENERNDIGVAEHLRTWKRYTSKKACDVFSRLYEVRENILPLRIMDNINTPLGLINSVDKLFIAQYQHNNNTKSALLEDYLARARFFTHDDNVNKRVVLGKEEMNLIDYCDWFLLAKDTMGDEKFKEFVTLDPKHRYFDMALKIVKKPDDKNADFASVFLLYGDFSMYPPERYDLTRNDRSAPESFLNKIGKAFHVLKCRANPIYTKFKDGLAQVQLEYNNFDPNFDPYTLHPLSDSSMSLLRYQLSDYNEILQVFIYFMKTLDQHNSLRPPPHKKILKCTDSVKCLDRIHKRYYNKKLTSYNYGYADFVASGGKSRPLSASEPRPPN